MGRREGIPPVKPPPVAGQHDSVREMETKEQEEYDFRNLLSKQGYEIKLTHRIAVGPMGGAAPVIYDMDWNPKPHNIRGKHAIAVLAAVSTFGTHLYYYPVDRKKWTTLVIQQRPSRKGQCLRWHNSGKYLATTSDPTGSKAAALTILSYDTNLCRFSPSIILDAKNPESKIVSLAWTLRGQNLVVSNDTSSRIHFFYFDEKTGKLESLGGKKCRGFPKNCPITLQSHPSEEFFFACSKDARKVLVWGFFS